MNILPIMVAGDTPVDTWTLTLPGGGAQPLTGAVAAGLKLLLYDKQAPAGTPPREGTGTFEIVDAAAGIVTYAWTTTDTATAGTFQIAVQVTFTNGQVLTFGVVNRVTQTIVNS